MLDYERAVKSDLNSVLDIIQRAFYNDKTILGIEPDFCASPEKLREYISSRRVWKLTTGEELVGCLIAYIDRNKEGFLVCVAVKPELQNKGFGAQAMDWLMQQFRSVRVWHCFVPTANSQTKHFFEQNGFTISNETYNTSNDYYNNKFYSLFKKDLDEETDDPKGGCLYKDLAQHGFKGEFFEDLLKVENVRIERIISRGQTSPESGFYDQHWTEIVLVLCGNAHLEIEGQVYELRSGDWRCIYPHEKHRVIKTSCEPPCVWYAIHISE